MMLIIKLLDWVQIVCLEWALLLLCYHLAMLTAQIGHAISVTHLLSVPTLFKPVCTVGSNDDFTVGWVKMFLLNPLHLCVGLAFESWHDKHTIVWGRVILHRCLYVCPVWPAASRLGCCPWPHALLINLQLAQHVFGASVLLLLCVRFFLPLSLCLIVLEYMKQWHLR